MINNFAFFTKKDDFLVGELVNMHIDSNIAGGVPVLDNGACEGYFLTPECDMPDFKQAVLSFSADTPSGSHIEATARVFVPEKGWSDYFSWGRFSPFIDRASVTAEGDIASVDADTLDIKNNLVGKKLQLKIFLRRENADIASPSIRVICASTRLAKSDKLVHTAGPLTIDNQAPAYCQGIRDPNTGFNMCSPTTATVIMNAMGANLLPEETALACWDSVYNGFGNWVFTCAAAGSFGYDAYCRFGNLDDLKAELANGPVGVSSSYSNTHERATEHAPYVEGTPGYTPGHLLTIRGMEQENGKEYFLVNDSYGSPDCNAPRRYLLEEFKHAWGGVMYIIRKKRPGAGYGAPYRVPAKLVKTDFGDEFKLVVDGVDILLPTDFNGSRTRCNGSIAYTVSDGHNYPTEANKDMCYTKVTANGLIFIPAKKLIAHGMLGDKTTISVFIITNRGVTYTATIASTDIA